MDRNWEERWGVETSASLAGKKPAPTHGTFKHQVPRQSRNKCTEESWPEILRYLVYSLTGFNHNPMVEGVGLKQRVRPFLSRASSFYKVPMCLPHKSRWLMAHTISYI